jgi:hypothetical protein
MPNALIISENQDMSYSMEKEFFLAGWSINSTSFSSMLGRASTSLREYQCITMILDANFPMRFKNVIEEIGDMLSNCSRHASLYLMFEGDYDPSFASWLGYTKRLFKQTCHRHNLRNAMDEIIRLESVTTHEWAFISPMNSI